MNLLISKNWTDYTLLDSGDDQRLEKFGKYILVRPDPQCIWQKSLPKSEWDKADAIFIKESGDKGHWQKKNPQIPNHWTINYEPLTILIKLSPFKHTGIFPEQSVHWEWIGEKVTNATKETNDTKVKKYPKLSMPPSPQILNLFGYTGISSLIAAQAGAKVTHVDASYPTIGWARENQSLSNLEKKPIRWILDDAIKFCQRELKRGIKYDGIIMDPPIYGHGPKGEKWDFEKDFPKLMELCTNLLSKNPLFVIVNAYATSASSIMLENVLKDHLKNGQIDSGELALQEENKTSRTKVHGFLLSNKEKRILSTGIYARWSKIIL